MKSHDEANRHENAGYESNEITIEVAKVGASIPDHKCPNPCHCHDEASRRRCEHRKGDSPHLGEVRQRRLTAICLPIRIGDEADCRVEGEQRIDRREIELIQRQPILEGQDQKNNDRHHQIGDKHVNRIGPPRHRLCGDA